MTNRIHLSRPMFSIKWRFPRRAMRTALGAMFLVGASIAVAPALGASPRLSATGGVAHSDAVFAPVAASFVDGAHGWVLGQAGCPSCLVLRSTSDGGVKWAKLPNPPVPFFWGYDQLQSQPVLRAVTDIRFVNRSIGFLFDPGFEVTQDGGRSWHPGTLSNVLQVVSAEGYVYALTQAPAGPVVVWRSPVANLHWSRLPLPTSGEIWGYGNGVGDGTQFAASQSQVLYLTTGTGKSLGSLYASNNFGRSFAEHPVPCTGAGNNTTETPNRALVATIVDGAPDHWVVYCLMSEWDNSVVPQGFSYKGQLFMTADAGAHWVLIGSSGTDLALKGVTFPNVLAAGSPSEVLLAGRVEEGGDSLVGTVNGGSSWSTAMEDGGEGDGWIDLDYVSPTTVFVVGPTHASPQHLYRSRDGGKSWCVMLEEPSPSQVSPVPRCA